MSNIHDVTEQKRIYYLRGGARYPVWLIGLESRDWQHSLLIEATHDENKAMRLVDALKIRLALSVSHLETIDFSKRGFLP